MFICNLETLEEGQMTMWLFNSFYSSYSETRSVDCGFAVTEQQKISLREILGSVIGQKLTTTTISKPTQQECESVELTVNHLRGTVMHQLPFMTSGIHLA